MTDQVSSVQPNNCSGWWNELLVYEISIIAFVQESVDVITDGVNLDRSPTSRAIVEMMIII